MTVEKGRLTSATARKTFVDLDLTYGDAFAHMDELKAALGRALKDHHSRALCLKMTLSKIVRGDKINEAYLFVNGPYFQRRECISFNHDGFIGFAGWASTANAAPILEAFVDWCYTVYNAKSPPQAEKA
jgi:hypothetical protein